VKLRSLRRRFEKKYVEGLLSRTIGNYLWSPVSVSVLAHCGDEVLVLKSGDGYSLPGGLNKGGEDLKKTGRREVLEETGCEVEVGELLEISNDKGLYPGVHFFFEAEVESSDLSGSWEGEPAFVEKSEVEDLEWELRHSHVHEYLFGEEV
jgi:ADP-ribose pyrophosphatase YjhB (NUDIX family)